MTPGNTNDANIGNNVDWRPLAALLASISGLIKKGGVVKSFKKGLIPMIAYFISHESHHRGQAILTLKQSEVKIPDVLKWSLWEWGK